MRFLATDQDILVADLLISLHKLFPVGVPVGQRIEDATLDHAGQALPSRQSSTESLNIVKLAAGWASAAATISKNWREKHNSDPFITSTTVWQLIKDRIPADFYFRSSQSDLKQEKKLNSDWTEAKSTRDPR